MHELSIALSLAECAEEELARQGAARVRSVRVRIGPLASVVKEALLFSWTIAIEGTPLEGAELAIEDVPVRVQCADCGTEAAPAGAQCLYCGRCGSARCRVVRGDEMEVTAMEVEDVPAAVG
ncbi:MAG TPA: hydrogenase maturation nickel metallochaperone HypA [Bryobacteraceae bacterium]|nr:hydrogenase maturation nickel metallochaperone HypA [Bryobacteraceae bacterium]